MTTRTDPAPEPYGAYVCADGRQVLYDRHYKPIWQRRPGQPATVADSEEWVKWDSQGWFYSDSDCHKKATLRRLQTVMRLFRTGEPLPYKLFTHVAQRDEFPVSVEVWDTYNAAKAAAK